MHQLRLEESMKLKTRVLVADDSHAIRTYVRQQLLREGLEVTLAEDGAAAINEIRRSLPDLAILDIEMPRVDGYGVCEELRSIRSSVPVIFLTANDSNAVQMLGEAMGAYLHKPIVGDRLRQTVREVLALPSN